MVLAVRRRALAVSVVVITCALAKPVAAATLVLGPWQDQQSVYRADPVEPVERPPETDAQGTPIQRDASANNTSVLAEPDPFVTPGVAAQPIEDNQDEPAKRDPRKLLPPDHAGTVRTQRENSGSRPRMPEFGLPFESLYSTAAALAIVVGLFLACAWLVRRGTRKPSVSLPEGVVTVLGRVSLTARQSAELVRVGNKLLLLAETQGGIERLTEIADPAEIDRIMGVCAQHGPNSASSEFDLVFKRLAAETASDDFDTYELAARASHPASEAYAAHRGGAVRG
jgi:flagellar biogenesis protein FliO